MKRTVDEFIIDLFLRKAEIVFDCKDDNINFLKCEKDIID